MRGIIGKVEHLRGLLKRHGPHAKLGNVIEAELGIRDWRELIDPAAARAAEADAIRDHVAGRPENAVRKEGEENAA